VGLVSICTLAVGCVGDDVLSSDDTTETIAASRWGAKDRSGYGDTYFASGSEDMTNPFFASLGTNGRTCTSCHDKEQGWSITPAGVRAIFQASDGTDPLFRLNDGAVSPHAPVATVKDRRKAYSMLLSKGLIRIGIGIPAGAEFTLVAVDDPYGYASAAQLSLFRRPLPSTNLAFLATVMWDGRETIDLDHMNDNFRRQANGATLGHAQATGTNDAQIRAIVAFETQLFTAQTYDDDAGALSKHGALGGPENLANQPFSIGVNDPLKPGFDSNAMTLFDAWAPRMRHGSREHAAIYRGQQIFNTRTFTIRGVAGLNDLAQIGGPLVGTCTTCHNTPNVGNHSTSLPLDIGIASEARRTSDMPLYTLRNNTTGAIVKTTDPGRALITGKWADIGKFKGPILRGLQMRPPFFHDGSAANLRQVIRFYNARFSIGLTDREQADLLAFLQAL